MRRSAHSRRIRPGTVLTPRELVTLSGAPVRIPAGDALVHLQFRRFAGCPVCNLHLQSFIRRRDEIRAAGIREVIVFHSAAEELRAHEGDLPFDVIPDPEKRLYVEFGVEAAPRAVLDPRVWAPIARAVGRSLVRIARGRRPLPPIRPHGGSLGLPADLLIAGDGRVIASKYGAHAYDQWSVDELLERARAEGAPAPRPAAGGTVAP